MSGPDSRGRGFSLVEVVIAIGVISFALLSILGVLSISMSVHQDASIDSVLSVMTESALQEVRNYNTSNVNLSTAGNYSFSKIAPPYTGYIYFNEDGQVTADAYWNRPNASGVPSIGTSTTSANQSTEVGVTMSGAQTPNSGNAGMPLTTALTTLPTGTYYTCTITTKQTTLFNGTTTPSMYVVELTFSWPPGASAANQHTRTVLTSISNNTN